MKARAILGTATARSLAAPFQHVHGRWRDDARVTAYAVVRDETYYLPSFLDHHRRLGVEQFLVLDDHSTDGTRDYLCAQDDCVVLDSPYAFGEQVMVPGAARPERAGVLFKSWIPQRWLPGRYALYLDADEYLVLPQGMADVARLFERLAAHDVDCVAASLVDFFPAHVTDLDAARNLPTSSALFDACGWFDAKPLLSWHDAEPHPRVVGENASTRLFRTHGIKAGPTRLLETPRWLHRRLPLRTPVTTVAKTPVVRWRAGIAYVDSHRANVPPTPHVLLGLAHVKFTHDLDRRIRYALESGAYWRASRKYRWYEVLLKSMRAGDSTFVGPHSRRYGGPADFAAAGLTQCDGLA